MGFDNTVAVKGGTKADKPDSGGAQAKTAPLFGVVKDNIDATRSGRIRVYITGLSGPNPDDEKKWVVLNFMSPFFGYTNPTGGTDNKSYGDNVANPISYGMWFSPPDIGTEVVCIFINGDPNYGFYIGGVPKPEALRMIPAIGANFDKENVIFNAKEATLYAQGGEKLRFPVANMNVNNAQQADSANFINAPKPLHSYTAQIMHQQGIIRDPIRGPISSSSQRESPSRVGWGISTPGRPIYEGGFTDDSIATEGTKTDPSSPKTKVISRRGGHSIVMDDGDIAGNDQLVRIRTALGHQILMSDDGQTLMILHSNGQSYIELGKEGTIDMYSTNSVNIRTQGDLNLHADNNININAAKNLNIFSGESTNIETTKDFNQKVGTTSKVFTMGAHTHKVNGAMSFKSTGDAGFGSSATTYITGSSRINLNTGDIGLTANDVPAQKQIAQTDTLYDDSKGWLAAPGKLLTIASRAPAHAPWANAGQGVDVKVSNSASEQLPAKATPAVEQANKAAPPAAESSTISAAGVATVPPTQAVSNSIDKPATNALVGAAAQIAASGPAAEAVKQGAGVVTNAVGEKVAAVGATALNPTQLEAAGVLKPGSATLVNSMVSQGANVATAMTSNLFTGKNGAIDLASMVNNATAQSNATVDVLQKAQTALTNAGAITGKESAGSIAGTVLAGATAGIGPTLNTLKGAATNVTGAVSGVLGSATNSIGGALGGAASAVSGALSGVVGSASSALQGAVGGLVGGASSLVNQALGAGNLAAGLMQTGLNGLSGIASAAQASFADISAAAQGAAASAFSAIKNSLKPFQAGVPQDLGAIADVTKAAQQASESAISAKNSLGSVLGGASSALTGALGGASGALGGAAGALTGALGGAAGALGGATSALTGAIGGATGGLTSALGGATGALGGITGAIGGAANSLGSAAGALGSISGQAGLTGALGSAAGALGQAAGSFGGAGSAVASLSQGISSLAGPVPQATSMLNAASTASGLSGLIGGAGAVASITNNLTSGLSSSLGSISGVSGALGGTSGAFGGALGGAAGALGSAAGALGGAAGSIGGAFGGLSSATSALGGLGSVAGAASSLINNSTSALTNSISTASAALSALPAGGALSSVLGGGLQSLQGTAQGLVGDLQNKLKSGANLSALASAGLPASAASALQSAISSISSIGDAAIALPSIGLNTTDRSALTAAASALIGDNRIPVPNFSGQKSEATKSAVKSQAESYSNTLQEAEKFKKEKLDPAHQLFNEKLDAAKKAKAELPAGDPKISEATAAVFEQFKINNALRDEYAAILNRI